MQTLNRLAYSFDLVDDLTVLRQLYGIDETAYDESSISFEAFSRWWNAYDLGLKIVKMENRITAALGLWGMSEGTTREFLSGQIREEQLDPMPAERLEVLPTPFWYCSGLVSLQQKTLDSPLRMILRSGLAAWVAACHVRYPANVFALGYSADGIALLNRFGFEVIRSSDEMPDGCPLYWRKIESVDEVRDLFGRKK